MENERLKRQIHAALDDCFAQMDKRPSQKNQIMSKAFEENRRRIAPAALVLAVMMMTILCGGAVAAKLGLFSRFISSESREWNGQRLEHLDEAAQTVGQTVHAPEGFSLTLEQAYCDGNRLYFAYTLVGETAGYVLGDGADLADGTRLTIWDRNDEALGANTTKGFQEVELPEEISVGDTLDLVLTVICPDEQDKPIFAEVPFMVTISEPDRLTGEANFNEYAAAASLILSGVEIHGEVAVTGPADWKAYYYRRADVMKDYIVDYQLIADGNVLYNRDYNYGKETQDGYGVAVRFDLPESYENLVLRPVRYLSGETPSEDIPIQLHRENGKEQNK